mmetsp:Transcript_10237/g.32437  ORF Transcript_10237/g.32437 Transcript_10237/m.32437 type:complete len:236 (+) Transcript_10237:1026-1733(+)
MANAPDEKEGLPYVLVGSPKILVHDPMDDLRHLVHKDHGLLLQDLRGDVEVLDLDVAVDGLDLPAGDHGVHAVAVVVLHVLQIVANDLRTGLPEPEGKQGAELDDGVLEDLGLHGHLLVRLDTLPPLPRLRPVWARTDERDLEPMQPGIQWTQAALPEVLLGSLLIELHVPELDGVQRVLADQLHLVDHPLDGVKDEVVRVPAEEQRAQRQQDDDKDRADHAHDGLPDRVLAVVK